MWQREELCVYLNAEYHNCIPTEVTLALPALSRIQVHLQSPASKVRLAKLGEWRLTEGRIQK